MDIDQEENSFSTSVLTALEAIDEEYESYPGLIITGSHAPNMIGDKLEKIRKAREEKIPFLGICLGMQLMMIEYARNVLKLKGANSYEMDRETNHPIFVKMLKMRVGLKEGESYWHQYKFNEDYKEKFLWMNLAFKDGILDMARIMKHPYFVGVQYHPEYQSTKDNPHPIFKTFVDICRSVK